MIPVLLLFACTDTDDSYQHSATELAIHEQIDAYRSDLGLEPLELLGEVSAIALVHSEDMADGTVEFGHDGFEGRADEIVAVQPSTVGVGENVALVGGYDDPAAAMVQGWLDSPPHKANIEGDWNATGIGVFEPEDPVAGIWYATQLFVLLE